MAIKHNNAIPNTHFRKDWQRRVRTHFDQPGKKIRRRSLRRAKAAAVAPRPVDKLRPVVRCPTIKYNRRLRAGRGFTLAELKAAGIPRLLAPTIGIAVDARRQNLSEESLSANVERLKSYKSKLILFPKKGGKPKEDASSAKTVSHVGAAVPFKAVDNTVQEISIKDLPKAIEGGAYKKLREARSEKRYQGARDKRAKDKAEAEANKK